MKTEHEKLFEICERIGYELEYELKNGFIVGMYITGINETREVIISVTEIIFTSEFTKKFERHLDSLSHSPNWWDGVYKNIDNPVDYLYNLLELGK